MIVVVTGASGAIGKEIARSFAQRGETLCLVANRHFEQLCAFADELQQRYSVRVVCAQADFAFPQKAQEAMRYALSVFGHVDCLVNNAAISLVKPFADLSLQEWQRVLDVNLLSPALACQTLLPKMYHRGGCIVNVSSMWGTLGASCESAYAASKAGLEALTKSLAQEYEGAVRVNALSLGFVDTPMNAQLSEQDKAEFFAEHPSMRLLSATQAAQAVMGIVYDERDSGRIYPLGWGEEN